MTRKQLYHALAILGTVIPWLFFGSFFSSEGITIPIFVRSLFVNRAAGGFAADLLLSITILVLVFFWCTGAWHQAMVAGASGGLVRRVVAGAAPVPVFAGGAHA
jgi:uncharacterized membrane protein YeiH